MSMLSRWAGLLPPDLRRAASGAWLDLVGLPGRLRDPSRWSEPWQAVHNVGGGDYARAGKDLLEQLRLHAGLTPACDVLDIGCGTGRLAQPLVDFLNETARYTGFDASGRAIALCRSRFARLSPRFSFVEADVKNTEYRAAGHAREDEYRFPAADQTVDVATAFSVFSHMAAPSIRRYLEEGRRVLRPGGRFAFTAYALTPERTAAIARGEGLHRFKPWRDGAMVVDARSPERAIAHPLEALEDAIASAGLELETGVLWGGWLGSPAYAGFQDLFVATCPSD